MPEAVVGELRIVDGLELPDEVRNALRPGQMLLDENGRRHRLPQYFYEIDSWKTAREITLAPCFGLYEFINTDVREARAIRGFPRYVPLAMTQLAAHLSVLRQHLDTYVHIAANGGYRSPGHGVSKGASVHHWGTAANIYRIGDDFLDSEETMQRYAEIVLRLLPGSWVRPFGREVGGTIDHLHVDLGRYSVMPRDLERVEDGDDSG